MAGYVPPVRHAGCHHAAICTRDWDTSMRFWSDGMGLQSLMEHTIDGRWTELFDSTGDTPRSVFLHDPALDDAEIVELVEFPSGIDDGTPVVRPSVGFLLLSFSPSMSASMTY